MNLFVLNCRAAVLVSVLGILAACDIPRPSSVTCDCQIRPNSDQSEWRAQDEAPGNFVFSEVRSHFTGDDPEFDNSELFDSASIHWYQNDLGQSLGCVVYDSASHVGVIFVLSADADQIKPVDIHVMGIPFGRHPFFWEGCADDP
ncbi:MAG: hypothetical protein AAFX56_05580 [Pseudomonadota bacterium]